MFYLLKKKTSTTWLRQTALSLLLTTISDNIELVAHYRLLIYTVEVVRGPVKIRDRWNLTTAIKKKYITLADGHKSKVSGKAA